MFPIRDENPTKKRAVITPALILINLAVFVYELILASQGNLDPFIITYALVPQDVVLGGRLYSFLTSMFLHGGIMHFLGNMLYLHIFGDNIEDIMGKKRFLSFYIATGIAASIFQIYTNPASTIPNLGASGAIAGVLGAYFVTFPRAKVDTVIFLGFFIRWIRLPAVIVLGFWFIIQLFSGLGSLAYISSNTGGVAFFAHIGGFMSGIVLVFFFKKR